MFSTVKNISPKFHFCISITLRKAHFFITILCSLPQLMKIYIQNVHTLKIKIRFSCAVAALDSKTPPILFLQQITFPGDQSIEFEMSDC